MRLDINLEESRKLLEADPFPGPSEEAMSKRGLTSAGKKIPDDILYSADGHDPINIWDIEETEFIYWEDLTDAEKEEFDYGSADSSTFFKYRDEVYDLGNFPRVEEGGPFARAGWHAIQGMSYWDGILVAIDDSGDGVKVARATW